MTGTRRRSAIFHAPHAPRRPGLARRTATRIGTGLRTAGTHLRTLSQDHEARQAAADIGVLLGTYHAIKRIPSFRTRTTEYLKRRFPPGSVMHGRMLSALGAEHARELGKIPAERTWLGAAYKGTADPTIRKYREEQFTHIKAKLKNQLTRSRSRWSAFSTAKKARVQQRASRGMLRLKGVLRERIGAKLHNAWKGSIFHGGYGRRAARFAPLTTRRWVRRGGLAAVAGLGALAGYGIYRHYHPRSSA